MKTCRVCGGQVNHLGYHVGGYLPLVRHHVAVARRELADSQRRVQWWTDKLAENEATLARLEAAEAEL